MHAPPRGRLGDGSAFSQTLCFPVNLSEAGEVSAHGSEFAARCSHFQEGLSRQKNRCVTSLVGHALHLMFGEL
jgi:hypothetical protein